MKDYIFIHINKCGGTSIKKALGDKRNKYQRYKHEKIADIAERMPQDEFEDTFKFAFIRHPYQRIKSMYFYRKYNLKRIRLQSLSFQEWFWKAFTTDFTDVPLMNKPCWDYISIDGALAVDFVGKVENMRKDWQTLCDRIGIDAKLPKVNRSRNKKEVSYTMRTLELIHERFNKDLEFYEDFSQ